MKRVLSILLGLVMAFGIAACNKPDETEEDFDLTATAWADNNGTLSVVFLNDNGISMTTSKDDYIFVLGTYSINGNKVKAIFTDRQDGIDTGGIKTLTPPSFCILRF